LVIAAAMPDASRHSLLLVRTDQALWNLLQAIFRKLCLSKQAAEFLKLGLARLLRRNHGSRDRMGST
jgi:hypothetical protein